MQESSPSSSTTPTVSTTSNTPPISHSAKTLTFRQQSFDTYIVDLTKQDLRFFLTDEAGEKLKSLRNLKEYVARQGKTLVFGTNAGMYLENRNPQGLYIEEGKEIRPLNLKSTTKLSNFYMKPNGIFLLTDKAAKVIESSSYPDIQDSVVFATQSGPMLLIDGKIHPKFREGSHNVHIRSGVGIISPTKVVFAISNELVNFYDFASLFKEEFGCENALYLDGAISQMYLPALDRLQQGGRFGAMIGVVE